MYVCHPFLSKATEIQEITWRWFSCRVPWCYLNVFWTWLLHFVSICFRHQHISQVWGVKEWKNVTELSKALAVLPLWLADYWNSRPQGTRLSPEISYWEKKRLKPQRQQEKQCHPGDRPLRTALKKASGGRLHPACLFSYEHLLLPI